MLNKKRNGEIMLNKKSNGEIMLNKILIGIILFFVICAIFCGIGGILFSSNLPANSTDDKINKTIETPTETPTEIEETETEETKEILTVTSKKLIEDYNNNELNADIIYKSKLYNITGKIMNINEILGQITISLSDDSDFCLSGVDCIFKQNEKPNLIKLNKGDVITVQGKIKGLGFSIDVDNCKVVK